MRLRKYRYDPSALNYEKTDVRKNTAKHWVLHLNVGSGLTALRILDFIAITAPVVVTGEYVTHSWIDWGEKPSEEDFSLGIYFQASPNHARAVGRELVATIAPDLADDRTAVISTAGDWAEQVELKQGARC